jgi:hypothetical protein
MKKSYLFLLFITLSIFSLNAQNVINNNLNQLTKKAVIIQSSQNLPTVPLTRTCYTVENEARLRAKYPQLETVNDFENWIQQKIQEQQTMKWPGLADITIPTIVHIIHDGGVSNISQAQVNSQYDVLNEDFRRNNPDTTSSVALAYQSVAIDSKIEFCKALIDPLGNTLSEPGIDRVLYSTISGLSAPPYTAQGTDLENIIKPNTSWDPTKYFNIWVVEMSGGILGYAQFPSSSGLSGMPGSGGAANTDGIVVGFNFFGRVGALSPPYNLGRTVTHEVGHWLGLRHIWGDANCGNDFCNDTPTQQTSNGGCPGFPQVTCGNTPNGDQYNNYMDYTNDACMNMFSVDQNARFQTVMANSPRRVELITSNVCNPNAPPICSFTSDFTTVIEGNIVTYTSTAAGATSWNWSFPGGVPSSSTAQNPTVTYPSGIGSPFDVTLIATNAFGNCNLTNSGYITVVPSTGCDTLNFPPVGTLAIYTISSDWAFGWNATDQHISKAEYFSAAAHAPYSDITGGAYYIYAANDAGNGANVDFNVWDATGAGGTPGTIIGTANVTLATLDNVPNGIENNIIEILYPSVVNVGTNDFYFGITMNGFGVGDSLGIVSNTIGDVTPGTAWNQLPNSTWESVNTTYGIDIVQFMSPYMTDVAPTSLPTANNTSICEGASINFDGSTSANATGYNWFFPSGTPNISTSATQTVTYATAGNYMAYLVIDGACQAQVVDSIAIIVSVAQIAAFSYSSSSYCTNETDPTPTITGTTGGNFTAFPTSGLIINVSTGLIDLSASTPGSYTVTYFTPGPNCIGNSSTNITINAQTTPTFTAVAPICSGDALAPLPTTSNNAITGTWSPAIDNTTTTLYTFTPVTGQCASTTTMTITVNLCTGIVDGSDNDLINIFPNPVNNLLNVEGLDNTIRISLIDVTGKLVYNNLDVKTNTLSIDLSVVMKGMYFLQIVTNEELKSYKIVKQ